MTGIDRAAGYRLRETEDGTVFDVATHEWPNTAKCRSRRKSWPRASR